jgi:non-specific serine/threonine protein kinase
MGAEMTVSVGGQVAGYVIQGLIGQGGMGAVYVAEHVLLGRKAALKTLLTEFAADAEFRERFVRESRLVASIEHPNIIPIYDAGEIENSAYIAMRYVQGYDLAQLLSQRGTLEIAELLSILDQAAAALDAAHTYGVVHRDVKPANILIEAGSNRIYLTDFGIAKERGAESVTRAGFFLGTIDYAAPEQIEGQEIGPRTDIYAFGGVLFECLCGRKPFVGTSDMAVLRAHVLDPPPKPTEYRPDLPAAIDAVIERALAKEPGDRFGSCRELVEAAQMALGSAGALTPRSGIDSVAAAPVVAAASPAPVTKRLPVPPTPIVGREQELGEVTALLRHPDVRLVTLTGFGGTGKTRLSLEAAWMIEAEFDLAGFADLAPIHDAEFVPAAIAQALGVSVAPGQPLVDTLREKLESRTVLLVLDNFEQVLPAAAFVTEVLAGLPELTLLVTSQSPLRVRGEREYAVPPLFVPELDSTLNLETFARSPAIALFVDRARSVKPDFELTEENVEAVGEICRRLDGIPLAIELAAARLKLLTPQALHSRLQRRLDLLTGGARDLPERQQTLRGAIDWSYSLLDETEQAVMARLGVFVGGCSLESAEAVCGSEFGVGLGELVDAIASLVDKSLVRQTTASDGEPRFTMLETIREYALDRLAHREEMTRVLRLHAERFLAQVETAEPELTRAGQAAWLQRLDEEHGNIRAALTWTLDAGEIELALRLSGSLTRFWSIRGHMAEGRVRLRDALERAADAPAPVVAKAAWAAGYAALGLGEFGEAERYFARSLELARSANEPGAEAAALAQLAWIAMTRSTDGGAPARALADESLQLARTLDDKRTASGALNTLAELALKRGDDDEALALYEEGLALRRGLGDKRLVANSLLNLGRARLSRDELGAATALFEEGRTLAREIGDTWSMTLALAGLGRVRLLLGEPEEAAQLFRDALRYAAARGDKRAAADCLQGLGGALGEQGDHALAAQLLGAADAALAGIGASPSAFERVLSDRLRPRLAAELGADFEFKLARGRGLTLDEALTLALPTDSRRAGTFAPSAL